MPLPEDYWRSYEHIVDSVSEFIVAVGMISGYQAKTGARFVWRGVGNSKWLLHSSLVRRYEEVHGALPVEAELRTFEADVIGEARDWGLDWHSSGGRLSALELLAALQHYEVPTRMLDFTYNPLIALWFAVEKDDRPDGRVFAIDISTRLVERDAASSSDPWWWATTPSTTNEWATESWIWRPPPFESRIVRQEACFLMGGIPSTVPPKNVSRRGVWGLLRTDEVRACMSVPFRLINYKQAVAASEGKAFSAGTPKARAFTLRIVKKRTVREELIRGFGYSHSSLFPDFPGYASYGKAFRRS
jgi:FRG domain